MGVESVFRDLKEIFPEVDDLYLRAVAVENPNDANDAVEAFFVKVMPFLPVDQGSQTSTNDSLSLSSQAAGNAFQTSDIDPNANGGNNGLGENRSTEKILSREFGKTSIDGYDQLYMDSTTLIVENGANNIDDVCEGSISEKFNIKVEDYDHLHAEMQDLKGFLNYSNVHEVHLGPDDDDVMDITLFEFQNSIKIAPESSLQLVELPVVPITEEEEPSASFISLSKKDASSSSEMIDCEQSETTPIIDVEKQDLNDPFVAEVDDLEAETTMHALVTTRSGQICSTELLESSTENARIEKVALRAAKDSLISLMKEVGLKEESVEQAKEEAARGGLGTLARVEELKQMLTRAKEANDMHSGEVYGERAILATEVKELQSRLLSLSDERVKAHAILEEMRLSLEERLTVAEKEIKAAEQAVLEKEEFAQKSLAYEESIMEKVVEESKILQQEAEENSKLREFLMDRGQLVDTLQGEIAVICQDVKLMKEKFDQRVPLTKSLSSSLTIIYTPAPELVPELATDSPKTSKASSTYSSDNRLSHGEEMQSHHAQVPEPADAPENLKASLATSSLTDDWIYFGKETRRNRKELMDDGWEFFDNGEFSI